ncbi:hypothetical protein Q3G72_010454 [Acer saccharum]|nr:hypothetical protein Q3G72_010454 [Acer saccharum]
MHLKRKPIEVVGDLEKYILKRKVLGALLDSPILHNTCRKEKISRIGLNTVKEALIRLDRTGVLAGRVMTFVNEKNSSKKALRRLKDLNPNIKKSELKDKCLDVFAAKTLAIEFLIKATNGTLYDDYEDEKAEAYLEWVAERMGIRRHVPRL